MTSQNRDQKNTDYKSIPTYALRYAHMHRWGFTLQNIARHAVVPMDELIAVDGDGLVFRQ